jgi:hypothetical protein
MEVEQILVPEVAAEWWMGLQSQLVDVAKDTSSPSLHLALHRGSSELFAVDFFLYGLDL